MKKYISSYVIPTLLVAGLAISCQEADIIMPPIETLSGKTKGYENNDGLSNRRETYEYDESGRVNTVRIEEFPYGVSHTDTYFYNASGQVLRINQNINMDKVFTWKDSKIIKSEMIVAGVTVQYNEFQYDAKGNIDRLTLYSIQADDTYLTSYIFQYTYFPDGNLYQERTYSPDEAGGENILISTKTFGNYIAAANPFPMVTILPTVKTQKQLPTYYRHHSTGYDITYAMSYEFRDDGKVTKRKISSSYGDEQTTYSYY